MPVFQNPKKDLLCGDRPKRGAGAAYLQVPTGPANYFSRSFDKELHVPPERSRNCSRIFALDRRALVVCAWSVPITVTRRGSP